MKRNSLIFFLLNTLWCLGQTPNNDPHWQLVWEDNFNTFDANKWQKVDWARHNNEPQLYLASNVSVYSGNLIIKTNNNPTYCPTNPPTVWGACAPCDNKVYPFTSGWIETQQSYNMKYGFIESRVKLPYGYGFWPAFWTFIGAGTMGSNAAEIDIFEMLGHNPSNEMMTNIHLNYPDGDIYSQKMSTPYYNYYNAWHTYGIEWSPSKIIWYVDGLPIRLFPNHGIIDPVRIILNLAIEPDHLPIPTTPFPSEMDVDFVKVYKLEEDCNTTINECYYDFSTYDNKVKREIIIGENSCSNSIPNNSDIYLRSANGVLIKGDFNVPVGSELYIDVNPCY